MLSQRQQRALLGLLEQPSKAAAAQAAGISPRALRSYLADPAFTAELQRLQDEQIADAAQRGRQSMTAAMSTLRAIADDKSANAQNRIMACRSLLEYSLKLDERENVLRRLDELEKQIGGDMNVQH